MDNSKLAAGFVAIGILEEVQNQIQQILLSFNEDIVASITAFLAGPIDPAAAYDFEKRLRDVGGESLRQLVQWAYNKIEPADPQDVPQRVQYDRQSYRRKPKSANCQVATLFGEISLWRFLYEPSERGEKSIHPLEITLGIVARNATPALAERVGLLAVGQTEKETLELLRQDYRVGWSPTTLRKVVAAVREGMEPLLHEAQVKQVLFWLQQADVSRGKNKIVLAVGRDGIFVPIRDEATYKEGSVATVSVYDRRGKRLGTIYLGRMPKELQATLSRRLTRLIKDILQRWEGPLPRLAYVTDAGYHPTQYFEELKQMYHPRRRTQRLQWIWIVDYYHASGYLSKLAEILFDDERQRHAWTHKMRRWMKEKPNGVFRVLHSAAKYHSELKLSREAEEKYAQAYNYLNNHRLSMDYCRYRRQGLPIGSGVTEAGCKTVFTQRFKQSGMSWKNDSGQVILDLRTIKLSGVWNDVYRRYLESNTLFSYATRSQFCESTVTIAA